jgi:uncharacterized peroxidase-related enzyme
MSEEAIGRFPVPEATALDPDIRARMDAVEDRLGFVPNVFRVLAHRPDEFRAFFAYYDAVMGREGGLTKAEKEMLVVATSAANGCPYCVIAHGAALRLLARDPLIADRLAVNWRSAPLTPRQRAMVAAAVKLARTPELLGEEDILALEGHGLAREDIWDIGAITALFALSNRMAHLTDMRPNEAFYTLGRERR